MNLDSLDQVARLLAYPVGAGILLNGVEELMIDATYFFGGLHRRERRAIPLAELRAAPRSGSPSWWPPGRRPR